MQQSKLQEIVGIEPRANRDKIAMPLEWLCESDRILVSVYLCLMLICCGLTLLIGHQEEHLACKK